MGLFSSDDCCGTKPGVVKVVSVPTSIPNTSTMTLVDFAGGLIEFDKNNGALAIDFANDRVQVLKDGIYKVTTQWVFNPPVASVETRASGSKNSAVIDTVGLNTLGDTQTEGTVVQYVKCVAGDSIGGMASQNGGGTAVVFCYLTVEGPIAE